MTQINTTPTNTFNKKNMGARRSQTRNMCSAHHLPTDLRVGASCSLPFCPFCKQWSADCKCVDANDLFDLSCSCVWFQCFLFKINEKTPPEPKQMEGTNLSSLKWMVLPRGSVHGEPPWGIPLGRVLPWGTPHRETSTGIPHGGSPNGGFPMGDPPWGILLEELEKIEKIINKLEKQKNKRGVISKGRLVGAQEKRFRSRGAPKKNISL